MNLYIKSLILYPKDEELKPRAISFEEDKINIITGYSQRGKSAIIDIIDYCLGSKECNIPVGPIRNKVQVFALYLRFKDYYLFLGRENYEQSQSTMYFYKEEIQGENKSLRSNEWLKNKNEFKVNIEYIKKQLNHFAGFKDIENEDPNNSFNTPASFRDTAAFQFQTQNIIANPTTMFYKTDSWEHLQKVKTILPLVLGYSSYEIITLNQEVAKLEFDKNKETSKLQEIKNQYENWQSEIYHFYSEAIKLGITDSDLNITASNVNLIKGELASIVKRVKEGNLYKKGSANRHENKVKELSLQRDLLIRNLNFLKVRLRKIEAINSSKEMYFSEVAWEKEKRLQPIRWFLEKEGSNICPFCNSESTKAMDELLSLSEERNRNQQLLEDSKSLLFSFEKERLKIKEEIKVLEESIFNIDSNLKIILGEEKDNQRSYSKVYEFIGRVDITIENLNKIAPSGILAEKINQIEGLLRLKRGALKKLESKFDKDYTLNKLTRTISKYVSILPIEEKETKKVHLDPDQSLNIKIEDTESGNRYFLSRLGSGANYMGYHIATILGLHEFFNKLQETSKPNYVPSFLVLDQPSQVYYPDDSNIKKDKMESKDIRDTRRIFEACVEFMKNTNNSVQLIILEHVPEYVWTEINDEVFNFVEDWKEEKIEGKYNALIPKEWF